MAPAEMAVDRAEDFAPLMEPQVAALSTEPELLSRIQLSSVAMSMKPMSKVNPRFGPL